MLEFEDGSITCPNCSRVCAYKNTVVKKHKFSLYIYNVLEYYMITVTSVKLHCTHPYQTASSLPLRPLTQGVHNGDPILRKLQ